MSNFITDLLTPLTLLWNSEWESDKTKYKLFKICKHNNDDNDHQDNPALKNSDDETNLEVMTIVTTSHSQLDL